MRTFNGKWQTYDILLDRWRDLTPEDIQSYESMAAAFGFLRTQLKGLQDQSLKIARGEERLPPASIDDGVK